MDICQPHPRHGPLMVNSSKTIGIVRHCKYYVMSLPKFKKVPLIRSDNDSFNSDYLTYFVNDKFYPTVFFLIFLIKNDRLKIAN